MKSKEPKVKDIYDKYVNGDKLSDAELLLGFNHFTDLGKKLALSGPVFLLAAREANRISSSLEDIINARNISPEKCTTYKNLPDCWVVCESQLPSGFWRGLVINKNNNCTLFHVTHDTPQDVHERVQEWLNEKGV